MVGPLKAFHLEDIGLQTFCNQIKPRKNLLQQSTKNLIEILKNCPPLLKDLYMPLSNHSVVQYILSAFKKVLDLEIRDLLYAVFSFF